MQARKDDITIFSFKDEFNFWGLQIKEHMLFMYQGLVEDLEKPHNLKSKAARLHNLWHNILIPDHASDNEFKIRVLELLQNTIDYQIDVQKLIEDNVWIGWLSFSFVDHLINESLYFKDKIENHKYSLKHEINFWLHHHQTEIEASEKLLDPLEVVLSEISKLYINQVKDLRADLPILESDGNMDELNIETKVILNEYLNQTQDLRNGIVTKSVLTNVSLPLVNHVIREGERAIQIFQALEQR